MVMAGLQPSSSSKMLTTKRQKHRRGIRTYRPASLQTYRTLNSKGRPPLKDVERGCVKRVADSGIQTKQGAPEGLGPGAVGDACARGSPETDRARRVHVGVEQRRDELALWRLREERRNKNKDGQDKNSGVGRVTR